MNQDVPQPATATRSPGTGSEPATSAASRAACRQQAGCESAWLKNHHLAVPQRTAVQQHLWNLRALT